MAVDDSGTYVFTVNCENLALGDEVTFSIWVKVLTGSTSRQAYEATYAHVQGDNVKISIPVVSNFQLIVKANQSAGTARAFEWSLDSI